MRERRRGWHQRLRRMIASLGQRGGLKLRAESTSSSARWPTKRTPMVPGRPQPHASSACGHPRPTMPGVATTVRRRRMRMGGVVAASGKSQRRGLRPCAGTTPVQSSCHPSITSGWPRRSRPSAWRLPHSPRAAAVRTTSSRGGCDAAASGTSPMAAAAAGTTMAAAAAAAAVRWPCGQRSRCACSPVVTRSRRAASPAASPSSAPSPRGFSAARASAAVAVAQSSCACYRAETCLGVASRWTCPRRAHCWQLWCFSPRRTPRRGPRRGPPLSRSRSLS
mmetsp:Transcript_163179/g.518496  ORF Transcript_163179/g.518496 Transcript_163179/m.518496 type:complete len:279 (-) Transcript_163179:3916-4752(-)